MLRWPCRISVLKMADNLRQRSPNEYVLSILFAGAETFFKKILYAKSVIPHMLL